MEFLRRDFDPERGFLSRLESDQTKTEYRSFEMKDASGEIRLRSHIETKEVNGERHLVALRLESKDGSRQVDVLEFLEKNDPLPEGIEVILTEKNFAFGKDENRAWVPVPDNNLALMVLLHELGHARQSMDDHLKSKMNIQSLLSLGDYWKDTDGYVELAQKHGLGNNLSEVDKSNLHELGVVFQEALNKLNSVYAAQTQGKESLFDMVEAWVTQHFSIFYFSLFDGPKVLMDQLLEKLLIDEQYAETDEERSMFKSKRERLNEFFSDIIQAFEQMERDYEHVEDQYTQAKVALERALTDAGLGTQELWEQVIDAHIILERDATRRAFLWARTFSRKLDENLFFTSTRDNAVKGLGMVEQDELFKVLDQQCENGVIDARGTLNVGLISHGADSRSAKERRAQRKLK